MIFSQGIFSHENKNQILIYFSVLFKYVCLQFWEKIQNPALAMIPKLLNSVSVIQSITVDIIFDQFNITVNESV